MVEHLPEEQSVGGSIPSRGTMRRSFGAMHGRPSFLKDFMFYTYILQSINFPEQMYIGYTNNIKSRLERHNNGFCEHTSKFKPWKIISFICFENSSKAVAFEKYLKSHSGKSFLKKRLI